MDSTSAIASLLRTQQNLEKLYNPSPAISSIEKYLKSSSVMESALKSASVIAKMGRSWHDLAAYSKIGAISNIANLIKASQLSFISNEPFRFSDKLSSIAGIGNHLQDSLKLSSAWELQSKINAAMGPSLQLQKQLEKAMGARNKWVHDLDSFNRIIPKIESYMSDFAVDDIAVDEDGSLTVADQSFTIDEINNTVSDIIDSLSDTEKDKSGFFELFFNGIENLPKPLKTVLVWVIIPFIINIAAGLATPHIKDLLKVEPNNNKQTIVREIKKQTPQYLGMDFLANYRFVTANILNVREGPSQKTKILNELVLGQVMRILHKKRNWTFVGYTDQDTGEAYQGWVFTRYIKKFKK